MPIQKTCITCKKTFLAPKPEQQACSIKCRKRTIGEKELTRLRAWAAEAGKRGALSTKRKHFERVKGMIGDIDAPTAYARAYRKGYHAGSTTGHNRGYTKGYEAALKEHGLWTDELT